MLTQIMRIVETIPKSYYEKELPHAKGLMGSVDIEDVPFIALALKMDVPIWSDDKHFEEQNKVKILKTRDIIELSE